LSKERDRRLAKLVELRSRAVDQALVALAAAAREQDAAADAVDQARARVASAEARRRDEVTQGVNVTEWAALENWLRSCREGEVLSLRGSGAAAVAFARARAKVADARSKLDRLEKLIERLAAAERIRAARIDRKAEDEFAARRSLMGSRR
jgi:flagellar export protein FliJ